MKMSVLRSLVLILAALIFFVRTGLSQESNGFWPLSGEFSADVTYVGEGDVERGGKHVNDFDEIDSDIQRRINAANQTWRAAIRRGMGAVLIWPSRGRRPAQYTAVLQHDYRTRYAIVRFHSRQSRKSARPVRFRPGTFVLG